MKKWIVVAVVSVALTGCNEEPVVESDIDPYGNLSCPGADGQTNEDLEPCEQKTCIWECVTYEGEERQQVKHIYRKCDSYRGWYFEEEIVRDASSQACAAASSD